jgi:alpha-1,6-mannosyltransferase
VAAGGFAAGVRTVLSWPVSSRRAVARSRAEEFGWPAAVEGFLKVHDAPVMELS